MPHSSPGICFSLLTRSSFSYSCFLSTTLAPSSKNFKTILIAALVHLDNRKHQIYCGSGPASWMLMWAMQQNWIYKYKFGKISMIFLRFYNTGEPLYLRLQYPQIHSPHAHYIMFPLFIVEALAAWLLLVLSVLLNWRVIHVGDQPLG